MVGIKVFKDGAFIKVNKNISGNGFGRFGRIYKPGFPIHLLADIGQEVGVVGRTAVPEIVGHIV